MLNRISARSGALLLAVLMVTLCLATSCGGTPKTPGQDGTGEQDTVAESETAGGSSESAFVWPTYDFEGREFIIYNSINDVHGGGTSNAFIQGPDDVSSNMVENAAYIRNEYAAEKMHALITYVNCDAGYGAAADYLRPLLLSEERMDLVINKLYSLTGLSIEGWFRNVADHAALEYFETYWYLDYMKSMSLDDGMNYYFLAGDYFMDVIRTCNILIYNEDIANTAFTAEGGSLGLMEKVSDGEWTLELMQEYIDRAYLDLDGDPGKTEGDRYGYVSDQIWGALIPFINSEELTFVEYDGRTLKTALSGMRSEAFLEKMSSLFYGEGTVPYDKPITNAADLAFNTDATNYFKAGNALFLGGQRFANMEKMTDMAAWSVLPYPKFDSEQKDYVTPSHDTVELGVVPRSAVSCPDFDALMTLLEKMTCITHHTVMKNYYEVALKIRYSNSPEVAEMVTIIHDHLGGAFALAYDKHVGEAFMFKGFYVPLWKETGFTSNFDSLKNSADLALESMIDKWNRNLD